MKKLIVIILSAMMCSCGRPNYTEMYVNEIKYKASNDAKYKESFKSAYILLSPKEREEYKAYRERAARKNAAYLQREREAERLLNE